MALAPACRSRKRGLAAAWLALALSSGQLVGCHSAFVNASVLNQTGGPVSLIEVDYPSASFGTESLAAGATFHYRFKILGSGSTRVTWTDALRHEHNSSGPALHEDQEGSLQITLSPAAATWEAQLVH